MKGTDVTDAQLAHAQEFLRSAAGGKFDPEFMESQKYVTVDKEGIFACWRGMALSVPKEVGKRPPRWCIAPVLDQRWTSALPSNWQRCQRRSL